MTEINLNNRGERETTPLSDIRELLDTEAARINSMDFIDKDPVQFPRRFERLQDIEIVALTAAIMAWGNRKMICNDIERLLSWMENEPYLYVAGGAFEELPDRQNVHRTLFAEDLKWLYRGLAEVYRRHGSLDAFATAVGSGAEEAPAWHLVEQIRKVTVDVNGGREKSAALPGNLRTTALKRVNMALRWLVRDDGIVDMGVWSSIPKSGLYIPLDVHVGNTSRELGLLNRRSNDRRSVEELTAVLRTFRPDDPCLYDFALFGLGVEKK